MYTKQLCEESSRMIKLEMWLETEGVPISPRLSRILIRRLSEFDDKLTTWQLDQFDELISMEISINSLKDRDISIGCEIIGIDGMIKGKGSIGIYDETDTLKSGLSTLILNNSVPPGSSDDIILLEERLYGRKSKQVPTWHIQLMKERLKRIKENFLEINPNSFIINFIIPIPSHPLKLRHENNTKTREDICILDVLESKEDSIIKRRFQNLFTPSGKVSNGDLRAIHGILQRGFDDSAIDSSNLLWNLREYLSKRFPSALIPFIQSIQWWLSPSDPTEIDEALRIIAGWKLSGDLEEREEICAILMVKMTKITGLIDSNVWINLFDNLLPESPINFVEKYQSPLILFLTSPSTSTETPKLKEFLLKRTFGIVGKENLDLASEIYWRLKTTTTTTPSSDSSIFEEYSNNYLSQEFKIEIKKQERLFEALEKVIMTAQKFKGPRAAKLELLKKLLNDPEASEIPTSAQMNPLLPGLKSGSSRIRAIVCERCNLFKSTAFTVLVTFLKCQEGNPDLSLPIIFKKGDDLRKDSACLRIFRSIWTVWNKEGGLNLFPLHLLYGVVPLGKEFGMVEYVDSVPLSKVVLSEGSGEMNSNEWAICRYLKDLPDPIESKTNFLTSCVGFSLLTYLLGIGDRHLDNLLLTPQGHLLHIDFSFMFGSDPKPFPPPIKITREMVRGFESISQESNHHNHNDDYDFEPEKQWHEFKGLCFTTLTLLRQKSTLLQSLIQSEYPSSPEYPQFFKERLSSMVNQAESLQKFDKLLEESRRAMFPQVLETIHKWVQYWKS